MESTHSFLVSFLKDSRQCTPNTCRVSRGEHSCSEEGTFGGGSPPVWQGPGGVPMELSFHPFEVVVLHLSVLLVAELLRGGVATWFQGSLLLATYCLVACGFFYLPSRHR